MLKIESSACQGLGSAVQYYFWRNDNQQEADFIEVIWKGLNSCTRPGKNKVSPRLCQQLPGPDHMNLLKG